MLSLKIQHSSGWRMSSRREEAILRQTSCVCVCAWWHSCRQNLEYSIITLAHPGTSRKASHKCLCANTHVCTHTPPPHISGTAGPLLRSSNTPAEGGGSCGGGLVVEEEGRAVGYGGAWGWWVTLRPRLNTNHPFSSVIGRFQAGSSGASQKADSVFVSGRPATGALLGVLTEYSI